ncbi:MAG: hypothetical protein IPP79_06560 [Chitinophagaceae bacterium]|nr:hypothetical protein [Chitinophagaceae bacterium]
MTKTHGSYGFFTAVNGNGDFYFDDISFYIELEPGQWKQLYLRNTSFEAHAAGLFDGFYVSKRKSSTLTTKPSESVFKTGHQSLYVSSRNQQPASLLTTSH